MLAGVAAVVADAVWNLGKTVLKGRRLLPLGVMLGAFLAVRVFGVNILWVILMCAVIGVADTLWRGRKGAAE